MTLRRFKTGVFLLEWINAYATAFFFNYVFFFLKDQLGFSSKQNLLYCALNGFVYMLSAWFGGRFGQRRGYMTGLAVGFGIMALGLGAGTFTRTVAGQLAMMLIWTVGMCFTWPTLEALVSEKESPRDVPKLVGIYNVIWAFGNSVAFFTGGAFLNPSSSGAPIWTRLFWIPALAHLLQFGIALYLKRETDRGIELPASRSNEEMPHTHHHRGRTFLRLAWIANPLAYLAINSAIPLIPDVAARLHLSPKFAGFFCSVWFFARMATFAVLGLWPGWHYRLSWLLSAYVGLIVSFCAMLLLSNLVAIVLVQILLGYALGLIYYSSLFYSLDVGEEKGDHSGIHETAIGAGIFAGPAIGAAAIQILPGVRNSDVWAVAAVLVVGLIVLLAVNRANRPNSQS